jgi:hypothetical protein
MLNLVSTLLVLFCWATAGADKQPVAEAGTEFPVSTADSLLRDITTGPVAHGARFTRGGLCLIEIFVKASKGALMTSYETSRLFGVSVLTFATLFFSSQLALAQFSQQGPKLVGTFAVGDPEQGFSVALSADGNTAIVGGPWDNSQAGAAWVYILSGGVWTQQGSKLVPTDPVGPSQYGGSVALSADGNTAIVGGALDNSGTGAAWVFTRSGGLWAQQGSKLGCGQR